MHDARFVAHLRRVDRATAAIGCLLVVVALLVIWSVRLTVSRPLYISELGATGEPTAHWFAVSLILVSVGGALVAWSGRAIRSVVPLLRAWTPAITLWVGCALFFLASQVTCSSGCPRPIASTFTWQDFIHTLAAVLAFVAACCAMLQVSFALGHRALRRFSLSCCVSVAVVAGIGGILSLVNLATAVGGALELLATTIALGWLAAFGGAVFFGSEPKGGKKFVGESDKLVNLVVIPVDPSALRL